MRRVWAIILVVLLCPFQQSNAAATSEADYRTGLAAIASKHRAKKAWLRAERAGVTLASVSIGGATPSDGIQVASLTKSITGIAVALLIQDGKLTLDTTLGEVLTASFAKKGHALHASMKAITVRRLLTHTAGLKTNYGSDPINGVQSNPIFRKLSSDARVFEYVIAADANRSNGSSKYVYSNFSYAFLGLVVEAVSGQQYEAFCSERIFKPLGIADATIRGKWRGTGPYAGWRMSSASMMKIWSSVLNRQSPTLLSAKTLDETLLAKLGEPRGANHDAFYALGVNVRQSEDRSAYRVWHNGIADLFWDDHRYSYMEHTIPGVTWMVVIDRVPERDDRAKLSNEVRALVEKLSAQ